MKQGKHQKPRPKFDWRTVDWEAVLLFLICIATSIVLIVMFAGKVFGGTPDKSTENESVYTYSEQDESDWIAPEATLTESIVIPSTEDEIPPRIHIGRCRLTIYTPHETHYGYATATGAKSQHLMTCAVDPSVIPYGSNVILIKADGTEHRLKAVDCGNFKGHMIDVFFDGSVAGGVDWLVEIFGEEYADVWIEKGI